MNTYSIFSRRFLGLDMSVWRLMISLILLSLTLLSYKILTKDKCIPFKIDVDRNSHADTFFYTGETIRFFSTNISEDISWDFDDKTTGIAKGSSVIHSFKEEGAYLVTARMDLGCEFTRVIYIKQKPQSGNQVTVTTAGTIMGVASTVVGKAELFISPILADAYYEWEVLKHPEMGVKNGEKASFTFDKADTYIIQLTLDGDRVKSFQKRLVVLDLASKTILPQEVKPLRIEKELEEAQEQAEVAREKDRVKQDSLEKEQAVPSVENVEPSAPIIKVVDPDVFRGYLQKLVVGEMNENEFYSYLCRGGSTSVVVNGDNRNSKTFSKFCQEYKGKTERSLIVGKKKPITIKSVKLIKDAVDKKCINRIEVEH